MSEWIADEPLDAVRKTGERFAVDVRIGRPFQVSANEWACSVAVQGLHTQLPDVRGGSALQALCVATALARQLLTYFVQDGGELRYRGTGERFDIDACFARVGVDKSGSL